MNKLLIFLLSLCVTSLEAATITNWGAQLPTAVPASGDVILMQKGGVTYYFTPNQLATQLSTNANLTVAGSDSNALYSIIIANSATTSNGLFSVETTRNAAKIDTLNGLATNLNIKTLDAFSPAALTVDTNVLVVVGAQVGVGTAIPTKPLEVVGNPLGSAQIKFHGGGTATKGYVGAFADTLYISEGATFQGSWVVDDTSRSVPLITMSGASGGSHIAFHTAPTNNTIPTERVRIDKNGVLRGNGNGLTNLPPPIDVFLIAGQSNAKGFATGGDPSPSVPAGVAWQLDSLDFSIDPVYGDPLTNGTYGSPWPQFAISYNQFTGRKLCFVQAAVGGSTLAAGITGGADTWGNSGGLRGQAQYRMTNALNSLVTNGFIPRIAGILWIQGESDGTGILSNETTAVAYKTNFINMVNMLRANLGTNEGGPTCPIFTWKIATATNVSDAPYAEIRQAQEELASATNKVYLVHRGASEFPARGLMSDTVHWNQTAANEAGRMGAEYIAGVLQDSLTPMIKLNSKEFRLAWDATNYMTTTISSNGAVAFAAFGTSPQFSFVGGITQTNGGIWQTWSLGAPSAPATQGAVYWNDGTNICAVFRNAGGALSTNKLSMTAWP